jgi:DNA end-binding protein Ku
MPLRRKRADFPRASWKGLLRVDLINFPVQAMNAMSAEDEEIQLHQLHDVDHRRIRHEKVCPIHGKVGSGEIVMGYQYKRGKYVEIEPHELDRLRTDAEKALNIDVFVAPETIDPIYFDGRNYYLLPDGPDAEEPYGVLYLGMERMNRYAVGQILFSGKEQLVLLRPFHDVLLMTMLRYHDELRPPHDFSMPRRKVSVREARLAESLVEAATDRGFDLSRYEDRDKERLKELIQAKVQGREPAVPVAHEPPQVLSFMDALRKSVEHARSEAEAEHDDRPPPRLAKPAGRPSAK